MVNNLYNGDQNFIISVDIILNFFIFYIIDLTNVRFLRCEGISPDKF